MPSKGAYGFLGKPGRQIIVMPSDPCFLIPPLKTEWCLGVLAEPQNLFFTVRCPSLQLYASSLFENSNVLRLKGALFLVFCLLVFQCVLKYT